MIWCQLQALMKALRSVDQSSQSEFGFALPWRDFRGLNGSVRTVEQTSAGLLGAPIQKL